MKTLVSKLKQLSPDCHEATRMHSRSLDGPLPWPAHLGLRIHLLLCKWCRRCSRQNLFLRAACRHAAQSEKTTVHYPLPEATRARLHARLKQELEKM
jgi:hypothetical protein